MMLLGSESTWTLIWLPAFFGRVFCEQPSPPLTSCLYTFKEEAVSL